MWVCACKTKEDGTMRKSEIETTQSWPIEQKEDEKKKCAEKKHLRNKREGDECRSHQCKFPF